MADQRSAPVEKLASVLGGRYKTKIEPSHFRRATEDELPEWLQRIGSRQPRGVRRVNEAVLRTAAIQEGGLNAFIVSGFEHPSISEIAVAKVNFNVRIADRLIHPGWWAANNGEFGESEDETPCFTEYGAGSFITLDPDDPPTREEIDNCFCVQECVPCDDPQAGLDLCEGSCN
jgi:hypothetical protein